MAAKAFMLSCSVLAIKWHGYLVLEYCHFTLGYATNSDLLHRGGKPLVDKILLLLLDVAKGMLYLHDHMIIHGDLKERSMYEAGKASAALSGPVGGRVDLPYLFPAYRAHPEQGKRAITTVMHLNVLLSGMSRRCFVHAVHTVIGGEGIPCMQLPWCGVPPVLRSWSGMQSMSRCLTKL
eukprot:1161536-Pelagomonas_calceolata.AAC.4